MTTRPINSSSPARRALPAALVAAVMALGLPTLAQATEPSVVKVHYSKTALKDEAGARAVYARLQNAARRACGTADGRDLAMTRAVNECREQAVARAVTTIGAPLLAAVHAEDSAGARLASAGNTRTSR